MIANILIVAGIGFWLALVVWACDGDEGSGAFWQNVFFFNVIALSEVTMSVLGMLLRKVFDLPIEVDVVELFVFGLMFLFTSLVEFRHFHLLESRAIRMMQIERILVERNRRVG